MLRADSSGCFFRFPILLYRYRLGWLLDHRFLMMTHVGRKTGQLRQVVLEVVFHDQQTNTYGVASGWGKQSNWVRNIAKNPQVGVQVGLRRWNAAARQLTIEEGERHLSDYARRHPVAFWGLLRWFRRRDVRAGSKEEIHRQLAARIPLFALEPQTR